MNSKDMNFSEIRSAQLVEIKDEEFNKLRSLIYKNIGINLTEEKRTLLMGRLQKTLKSLNFTNFSQYYDYLVADKTGNALSNLANTISTNHTFFWREKEHFDFFQSTALPEIAARAKQSNSNDIRIWCAGCSTGEEPYTLGFTMMEFFGQEYKKWDAGVLATDISAKVLDYAIKGVYPADRVKMLPDKLINKYFYKTKDGDYEVKDELKREITYRRFNLMNHKFPFKKRFDAIFCRNVMIYFDNPTRETLVNKFYDLLVPGGYLFIGHSESLNRNATKFAYIQPALYKK